MKTKEGLEKDIIEISMKIHREFPELSKYISEMPVKNLDKNSQIIGSTNFKDYYNSLAQLLAEYAKTHSPELPVNTIAVGDSALKLKTNKMNKKDKKELEENSEIIANTENLGDETVVLNEKNFEEDMTGEDLDIPGVELDDQQENVGSEDEENNYYSIGGDEHGDLDENNS